MKNSAGIVWVKPPSPFDREFKQHEIYKTNDSQTEKQRCYLQRGHAHRGDQAILSVAGRRSEFDAVGDIVLCMRQLNLSASAFHRILKLARTIADLAGSKEIQSPHLAQALRYAARGEATFDPQVAASIVQYIRGEQDDLFLPSLSNREMDVLKRVASGLTNSQIAQKLQISENTVKGHLSNIRTKLQIANRVHLAVYAWENGIVSPSNTIV